MLPEISLADRNTRMSGTDKRFEALGQVTCRGIRTRVVHVSSANLICLRPLPCLCLAFAIAALFASPLSGRAVRHRRGKEIGVDALHLANRHLSRIPDTAPTSLSSPASKFWGKRHFSHWRWRATSSTEAGLPNHRLRQRCWHGIRLGAVLAR